MTRTPPLADTLVVDASRMVPGAVLARNLVDLGARLIKIEDPRGGDPLRAAPPLVEGIGAGFCLFFRGTESVALDLRSTAGKAALESLLRRADVFLESFRPGTLERWGIDLDAAAADNPRLVICSLPGFAPNARAEVAHDLNLVGLTGLLEQLPTPASAGDPGAHIPKIQVADVNTGLLACSSILAALLRREKDGLGGRITQPLVAAALPLVAWAWADRAVGGADGLSATLLSGRAACYRCYRCEDDRWLTVACLEPKFWTKLLELLDLAELPNLGPGGFDVTPVGAQVAAQVAARFATQARAHWLALFTPHALPVAPVHGLDDAMHESRLLDPLLVEELPLPGGNSIRVPGPAMTSIGRTPDRPAPRLGAHTQAVLEELREA